LGVCALAVSAAAAERIRESALAGGWYPADPAQLQREVDTYLAGAEVATPQAPIRALIAPHAGYAYSGPTAGAVFSLVKGRSYKRVLVLAPSHYGKFRGLAVAEVDAFHTPLGDVPVDLESVQALRSSPLVRADADVHAPEHSIEIELPLLQRALQPGWHLVPVLVGGLDAQDYQIAADLLRPLADDATLVVVSSDFTHYGYRFNYLPFPPDSLVEGRIRTLDDGAISQIQTKDAEGFLGYHDETGITICGFRPIGILLRMLGPGAEVHRIAYGTSGDLTGDWGNSVSYVGMAVTGLQPLSAGGGAIDEGATPERAKEPEPAAGEPMTEADLRLLHRLAILALEAAVLGPSTERDEQVGQAIDALPARLREPAGVFVTLKRQGALRGCIGYIEPREPLYRAVLANGDNAARHDPRFPPVQASELEELDVEVSVLTPPRPIASWEEFRVREDGIVLSKDGRRAVFLPEVAAERGWTKEETLAHLAVKAGLLADDWRDGASFSVFTSTKYGAPYRTASVRTAQP
jgi:AmmeMemoRadiSam system protein B/AmmeMemoRadiSam system protein A